MAPDCTSRLTSAMGNPSTPAASRSVRYVFCVGGKTSRSKAVRKPAMLSAAGAGMAGLACWTTGRKVSAVSFGTSAGSITMTGLRPSWRLSNAVRRCCWARSRSIVSPPLAGCLAKGVNGEPLVQIVFHPPSFLLRQLRKGPSWRWRTAELCQESPGCANQYPCPKKTSPVPRAVQAFCLCDSEAKKSNKLNEHICHTRGLSDIVRGEWSWVSI